MHGEPCIRPATSLACLSATSTPRVSLEMRGVSLRPLGRNLTNMPDLSRSYVQYVPAGDQAARTALDTLAWLLLATAQELDDRLPPGESKDRALDHLQAALEESRDAIVGSDR